MLTPLLLVVWGAGGQGGPSLGGPSLGGPGGRHYTGDYYPDYPAYSDYQYDDDPAPLPLTLTTTLGTFTLPCTHHTTLTHEGAPMEVGGRVVAVPGGYRVTGAVEGDGGVWGCGEEVVGVAVIPTTGGPILLDRAGRVVGNQTRVVVSEGEVLHYSCAISSSSSPWPPVWKWDGEVKEVEEEEGEKENAQLISRLPPFTARREQEGAVLSCTSGGLRTSVEVEVHHAPEFTIGREPGFGAPVAAGSALALLCTVEAAPPSAPYWEREGAVVAERSRLEFPVLEERHEGWYVCSTHHKLGNFSSVGYYLSVRPRPSSNSSDSSSTSTTISSGGGVVVESSGAPPLCSPSPHLPRLTPTSPLVRGVVGESATLGVEVCSGREEERVMWSGPAGVLVGPEQEVAGVRVEVEEVAVEGCRRLLLRLEDVQERHRGEWLLVVRNR